MVLLHSAWKFHGLAGATMLLTVVIVISGFIGRYIYTRIPRTTEGLEMAGALGAQSLARARRMMSLWHSIHVPIGVMLFTTAFIHVGAALYYATLLH
jgi:cytochrome b561